MVRILQVVTYMGRGGLETMLMNYYRNINRDKIQFDFLVHRDFQADYDDEIEELGGVIYRLPVLNPFSKEYRSSLGNFFDQHPEYEIVHVHQDCMSSLILKAAKKHGVPVRIAHSHNSKQEKNLKLLIKLFYKRLIPKYSTDLMGWNKGFYYKVCGEPALQVDDDDELLLVFQLEEAERYLLSEKDRQRFDVTDEDLGDELENVQRADQEQHAENEAAKAEGRPAKRIRRKGEFPKQWDTKSFGTPIEKYQKRVVLPRIEDMKSDDAQMSLSDFEEFNQT